MLVSGLLIILLPQAVSAAKVTFSPASVSLTEGQSQVVQVTLDEPIVCGDPEATCDVSIAISTDSPDRVTIDTSPVVFADTEWAQTFTFTITAVDDNLVNGDITPTVTALTTSSSEYYSDFTPTLAITVIDNDTAPAAGEAAPAAATNQPTLAGTGQNLGLYALIGTTLLAAALLIAKRKVASPQK